MKKLKKIIFGMIFASVISVIGISSVKASGNLCFDPNYNSSTISASGSYSCAGSNSSGYVSGSVFTLMTGVGSNTDNTFSKAWAYYDNYNVNFNGFIPSCNFIGGYNCSSSYLSYDFYTYPVNSSSVAYSSEPIGVDIGNPYTGVSTYPYYARMNNIYFDNNFNTSYDAGTYVVKFFLGIAANTDSDWNDNFKVEDAFYAASETINSVSVSSDFFTLTLGNNLYSNTYFGSSINRSSVVVNSISRTWYHFNNSVPYVNIDDSTYSVWHVLEIDFNITSSVDFKSFSFGLNLSNQGNWSTGASLQENTIFAGAFVEDNIFIGLDETYLTLDSSTNFTQVFSDLPLRGRIIFENVVRGSSGTNSENNNMTLADLNGAMYYIKLSGNNIFDSGSTQIIGYKTVYCDIDENKVCYFYIDYDLSSRDYDGLAFISSGIATQIVGNEYQKNSSYCDSTYSSSWFGNLGKKVCNFYARTPLLNKIITKNREKALNKGDYYSFTGSYNVKIWAPSDINTSVISYNNGKYSWSYTSNGVEYNNNDVTGVLTKSDLVGNLDFSLIMPTLTVMNTDINNVVNGFTTGRDSSIFIFIFSFLLSIMTIAILKAGVKH